MAPHRQGGQAQYVVAPVPERSGARIAELHLELELVEPELFFDWMPRWVNAWQRISSGS